VIVVLPAHRDVHLDLLRHYLAARALRLATEAEITRLYDGCEPGAVPPLGPLYHQKVVVDTSLTSDPEIVFNGGSHRDAIRMRYADFVTLVHPTVADFAVPSVPVA
jgi:Ala-tRNA(Pro) deacylase